MKDHTSKFRYIKFTAVVGMVLCELSVAASVATAQAQLKPLERIGIQASEDGAQFIVKESGNSFFVKGFNYVRLRGDHATFDADTKNTKAYYDPDRAEAMFSALSKAGYNTVRVFIIGRSNANPGIAGNYDTTKALYEPYMENVLDFLRRATRHGIYVFPTFGDGGVPLNAYYRQRLRGKGRNRNVFVLTKEGIATRIEHITSFLSYVKDKKPALLPTLLGLQCQNEAYLRANQWPFTEKEGKFTAANGKTYDLSSSDERQALMDEGYHYYHQRIAAAVKAIDAEMLVAEGVFVLRAVGKDPEQHAGVWPGKTRDERYPPMLTAIGKGPLDFLDVHFYPKKEPLEKAFRLNLGSTGFFTPEMAEIRKKKPVIMGEFGMHTFVAKTFEQAVDNMVRVRDLALTEGLSGMLFWTYDSFEQPKLYHAASDWTLFVRKMGNFEKDAEQRRKMNSKSKSPLERDWLFQAGNDPKATHVQQEITWTRRLAERITKGSDKLDLSAELKQLDKLEGELKNQTQKTTAIDLYLAVRRLKRSIAFKNPVVDFSKILLVDNPYPDNRHESAHRHGYRASGKGRLLVLEGLNPDSPVRSLVPEEKAGFLWRPDLSFDAEKIVFCLMPNDEKSYHLYEVNTDGTGFKQLTFGDYDDLDPIYLPNGKLLFNSSRANTYVRCGPTHHSPVLARCDADGKNIYIISRNNEPDYLPSLLPDGRVIYTRWEYTDKEQKRLQSLWTMNPDGTGVYTFWGNQSVWPDILAEPRAIPGTKKIMFTGVGHHLWFQGSIGIIDQSRGMNYPDGLSKVTSEIAWPEVGNGPQEKAEVQNYHRGPYGAYKTPYPIGEEDFLVSIMHPETKKFSLYLMDLYGNRELIYTGKDNVWHAMPLKPRVKPPAIPDRVQWPKIGPDQPPLQEGILYSANVFEDAPLLPKDKVKYLRVLQIDAKTYTPWKKTYQHSGPSISVTQADGVKRILGTTPVEADGSVCFKVPPGVSLHFQLLDKDYRCVQTMRTFTGVMPGEIRGCLGCHEGRSSTPVNNNGGLAMRRGAMALKPPPWGAETSISYSRFVQPVLDKYCGSCHQGDGDARQSLDLTLRDSSLKDPVYPNEPPQFKEPYITLVGGGNDWYHPVDKGLINKHGLPASISGCLIVEGYRERTPEALATLKPMTHMSSASLLINRAMDEKHIKTKMDSDSLRRLIGWVDANGPYLGEEEIRQMPDPTPETRWSQPVPVVKPRLKTAPKINRFNIRQDGDSSKIYLQEHINHD